jgi:hypothetical protein
MSNRTRFGLGLLATLTSLLAPGNGSPASAATAGAGYTISSEALPTVFAVGHNGSSPPDGYIVTVTNSGDAPTDGSAITVVDTLPAALAPIRLEGSEFASHELVSQELACDLGNSACTFNGVLPPGGSLRMFVGVSVSAEALGPLVNAVSVSGGGAKQALVTEETKLGSAAESLVQPYGLEHFNVDVTGVNGENDMQAGDHPYEITTSFDFNSIMGGESPGPKYGVAGGRNGGEAHTKDVVVDLSPGFIGNPQAVPECPEYLNQVGGGLACPPDTQVGVATITLHRSPDTVTGTEIYTEPIFNIVPDKGYPAQFAFNIAGQPVMLYVSVNPATNYGVRVTTADVPEIGNPGSVSVTFFGTPSTDNNVFDRLKGGSGVPVAFLDSPTDCSAGPLNASVSVDSWEHPGVTLADGSPDLSDPNWKSATTTVWPGLTRCDFLQFDPSIEVSPETSQADEPTGVTVHLGVPQALQQAPLLITPELKDATVTLPSGLSVSPSAADGLQGCTPAQIALGSSLPGNCPPASTLGTVRIVTPLLPGPLTGHVFLKTPGCDPCSAADAADGNMVRLFLEAAGFGVVVKKEGTVYVNSTTGQLTTTFVNNPELSFSDLELHFKGGLRAPLATPQSCGTFTTTSDLVPWSTPITADANPVSPFGVNWNGGGAACPSVSPFSPEFSAGTSNPNAGQLSPLTVTFSRQDREQDLAGVQVQTPPGLLGSLSQVPLCGEPAADLGTCPEASRIGTMTVAAGAGPHPFYERGSLYLTGPYRSAPFGLSIVVPTVAGPFNLGNVVVRAQISIDPHTTALTVTADPFPQVIDGIPLRLRTANVTVDRPNFIFNPTSCAQQQITATITGAQGAVVHASTPFAVSGCAGLPFAPKFSASVSGKTSRADGASLDVKLLYSKGAQSNIAKVKVDLPKQLPSRLTTLQKACPDRVFETNPAACPRGSLVGVARTTTPILPVALMGPAYFVSHGGAAFPDLIVVLQGYGVRVDLIGSTFISRGGITNSTFRNIPDVPVGSFELYLPQGPDSALAANGNLCTSRLAMPTAFTAQDGAQLKQNTQIKITGCPRAKAARAKRKAGKVRAAGRVGQSRGKR